MNCEIFENLLPLYLENTLQSVLKRNVERHIHECPACCRLLSELKVAEFQLQTGQLIHPKLPENFEDKVLAAIEIRRKRDPVRIFGLILAITATISFVMAVRTLVGGKLVSTLLLAWTLQDAVIANPDWMQNALSVFWPLLLYPVVLIVVGVRLYFIRRTSTSRQMAW